MREVELTIEVLESLDEVIKKIESKGFKLNEKYYMKDYYMIHKSVNLNNDNYSILKKCLLIREINSNNQIKLLTYKNKNYDENGCIISQQKIKVNIDSIDKVKSILEAVDHYSLFEVENNSYVYKKENIEFVIQSITNPKGLYIEMEATDDELLDQNDENVKALIKQNLDALNLKTTGDYEVKKAIIALKKVKEKLNII